MAQRSELTRARLRSAWLFLAPMLVVLALVAGLQFRLLERRIHYR